MRGRAPKKRRALLCAVLRFALDLFFGKVRRVKFFARPSPRHGAAIVAGLLLALSFPKAGVAGFAYLAPGLMLFAALGLRGKKCFRIGYVAGLANYLCSLYWLLFIPFPAGAVVGWLALSAYLALYSATWVWLCWKWFPDKRFVAEQSWWTAVGEFFTTNAWERALWTIFCAALWVALEMVVARFLSGFPWIFLGVSQYRMLPLIQIASVAGVYGVSFLVAWFSVSLAIALLRVFRQPQLRWAWLPELGLPIVGLMIVACSGVSRLRETAPIERELKVALVQPSIPQALIWDHREDANRFSRIMALSKLALAAQPDLLIWPEASLPGFTEDNFRALTNLIATHKVWMIFGADDAERRPGAPDASELDYFNAAFLFDPEGRYVAKYRKQRLVAFGEYLPLARWLPFLRKLIPVPGDFTPGDRPLPLELTEPRVKIAVLICFEDVFPHLVRDCVPDDTDFLLNLTNDGWFGESAAHWQQAANAVFRAVENGLPLVRCTNNGLTCWIDSRGRLQQILRSESGNEYAPGFLIARIPLFAAAPERALTFYHRHGDWFGWSCVAIALVAVIFRLARLSHWARLRLTA